MQRILLIKSIYEQCYHLFYAFSEEKVEQLMECLKDLQKEPKSMRKDRALFLMMLSEHFVERYKSLFYAIVELNYKTLAE